MKKTLWFLKGILIMGFVVTAFCLASVGMWDKTTLYLVQAPDGVVVAAYYKAAGHTGHKLFVSPEQIDGVENFETIQYKEPESVVDIIDQAGRKAWVDKWP